MPAVVPTGVPPPLEGVTVTVTDDVGCGVVIPDDGGAVEEDAVDKIVLLLLVLLAAAGAEDVEARLILK